jgi:tetratricopeptide (TPR) repeat protein
MMRTERVAVVLLVVLVAGLSPAGVRAQDPLARAKDFYASAAYEDALQVLNQLQIKAPAAEVAAYQVYCLLALGRNDEAKVAIERLVRIDPVYRPSEADASPRVRAFFDQVRRPLIPDIVRQTYAKGKDAFYKKDMPTASSAFDRVVRLLDDMDVSENEEMADLRTLAGGFRELSKAAPAPPPPTPMVSAQPTTAVPAARPASPLSARVFGPDDPDVSRPVPVARVVPRWRPVNATEERLELQGTIELLISEVGTVLQTKVNRSIHPRYDPVLLKAARDWTFRPAMHNGAPVKYRYAFDVHLGGTGQ